MYVYLIQIFMRVTALYIDLMNATSYKSMGNFDAGFKTPAEKDAIDGSAMPRALGEWRLGQFEQMPWLEALSRDRQTSSRDDLLLGLGEEQHAQKFFLKEKGGKLSTCVHQLFLFILCTIIIYFYL